jgi:Tfp pilus assembly protein PilN
MSVRVNLLPSETAERQAAVRQRTTVGGAFLVLLLLLGGVYFLQANRIGDARDELAAEQARTNELQAEVDDLNEFDELRVRRDDVERTIVDTLSSEVGFAAILQDLAAVMPSDAQLDTLSVTVGEEGLDNSTGRATVGGFAAQGQTLTSHAPGVERLLLALDKVAAFLDLHIGSSALIHEDDDDIAAFEVEGQLGDEVLTGRYLEGLPEELR